MNTLFVDEVKEGIKRFNETRGSRKELSPNFVETISHPYNNFGLVVDCKEHILSDVIPRMAGATVRTLLKQKSRPQMITVAMLRRKNPSEYLFRLQIEN